MGDDIDGVNIFSNRIPRGDHRAESAGYFRIFAGWGHIVRHYHICRMQFVCSNGIAAGNGIAAADFNLWGKFFNSDFMYGGDIAEHFALRSEKPC